MTDLEASTEHLRVLADAYGDVLAVHHRILRDAIAEEGGTEIGSEGDSFAAIFPDADAALRAAVSGQLGIARTDWPDSPWRVRVAVHEGVVDYGRAGATGMALHEAARLRSVAHGGQIIMTDATRRSVCLPDGVDVLDLGTHAVRDFNSPVRVHQVCAAGLDVEFPALRTMTTRRIPASRTPFVGRSAEVVEVSSLLEGSRVVTVTGAGGIGKTRVAYELARRSNASWVVAVELAGLRHDDQVVAEVASVLGSRRLDGIADVVGACDLLLVLDNCEHLVGGVAALVSTMIDDCPELTVLATSREPLGVTGEAVWALPPLGIDDAVALFRNRTPGSAENDPELSIAACERLGRMPLAIELAAARMRSIALPDLVARLDDQLGLLISGARDSPRHQTLRATLEWSHDLLTPEERSVFRRMAVFAGGGSLAAIEVVAAEGGADVVRALDGLVNKSLVLLSPSGGRYHLLEPIRQFAVDQLLASGELELAQRAHAAWACGFAREANRGLFADQRHWTAMLAAERDNLGAAIGWMLSHGQAEAAAGLISNLAWYWFTAGRADSFVWVALVLDRLGELPPPARAKALLAAGISHCDHFDDRRPLAWLDEAATIFRRIGNRRSLGAALFWLGRATAGRLDFQRAEAIFVESLAVHEEVGDLFGVGWSLTWTGCLARLRGDLDQDEAIQHSVLERCEAIPHVVGQAFAELSFVANERGDWVAADELIGRAVEVYRDLGDRWQLGLMTGTRASHLIEADPERAVAYNIESLTLLREMDADPNVVYGLETAAALLLEAGRTREAATVLGSIKGDVAGRDIDGWDRHRQTVLAKLSALIDDPTWAVEIDRGRRGGVRGATEAAIHWLADGPPHR